MQGYKQIKQENLKAMTITKIIEYLEDLHGTG